MAWKRKAFNPRRLAALYLMWLFFNIMLLVLSPTPLGTIRYNETRDYGTFYPIEAGPYLNNIRGYPKTSLIWQEVC